MERKGTMTEKTIRLGIIGYGNLGKGAELAIRQNPDLALTGIFTRRDPSTIDASSPVYAVSELERFRGAIDVCLLCGGSARDLDRQGPDAVRHFHTVDSFDTHARIPAYYETMDAAARASGHLALISVGWD
ncbi:MAG TPA: diaminopimelate dehydrogenase, partial [Clostridiaceae bacterium]|nr:diaminopimelate dehydrogenase [Clostridiaceae bacterium]